MHEFSLDPDQSSLTFCATFNKHKAVRVGHIPSEMQRLTAVYCKSFREGVEVMVGEGRRLRQKAKGCSRRSEDNGLTARNLWNRWSREAS